MILRSKIKFVIVVLMFTLICGSANAGFGDKWNRFREKHIDPVGDKVLGPSTAELEKKKEAEARRVAEEEKRKAIEARKRAEQAKKEA